MVTLNWNSTLLYFVPHHTKPGDPAKPRFRLDLDLYAFLHPTTMSDVEIINWFTASVLGWQLSVLFVLVGHLGISKESLFQVLHEFLSSFYAIF